MSDTGAKPLVRFCLRCCSVLPSDLNVCTQCGWQFDPEDRKTYRRRLPTLSWTFWFPGLCLSIAAGVFSYATILIGSGEMGAALFVAVPLSFGAIVGYTVRVRGCLLVMLSIIGVVSVIGLLASLHLAGFFCGFTLGLIFFGPMIIGLALGRILAERLKTSRWPYRHYLPIGLMLALPHVWQFCDSLLPHPEVTATVETELTLHSSAREAWESILFYDQVEHDPPVLTRFLLPRPLRSEGSKQHVGDVVRCVYTSGRLCKEITEVVPERRLAFRVTEQTIFDHDVTLLGGSFEVTPVDDEHTVVRLSTKYRRKLRPGIEWEPIERAVIHSLHEHVLEGMRRRAERAKEPPAYQPPARPAPQQSARVEAR